MKTSPRKENWFSRKMGKVIEQFHLFWLAFFFRFGKGKCLFLVDFNVKNMRKYPRCLAMED